MSNQYITLFQINQAMQKRLFETLIFKFQICIHATCRLLRCIQMNVCMRFTTDPGSLTKIQNYKLGKELSKIQKNTENSGGYSTCSQRRWHSDNGADRGVADCRTCDWRTSPAVPPLCRTDQGTMATRSRPGKPQESLPDRDPSVLTNGELV